MGISALVLVPLLVGAILLFAASEGSSMVASSEKQTDQIHHVFEQQSDTIHNVLNEYKNENDYGVNRNLINGDTSVLTNRIYEEDEAKHSPSLYQKLMGRRKVDPKEYQQQDNGDTGKAVGFFRRLINAKNKIGDGVLLQVTDIFDAAVDSDGLVMIKEAIRTIMETILHAVVNGFLPTVERVRREADGDKRTYLDMLSSLVGAMIGRQSCGDIIACRMGKWFQGRLPAAQLVVMMVESVVPAFLLDWFGVVKKSVIDRSDNCDLDYECSLQDD